MIAYNPSVNDRSGELIAGGISQAASGISGAIDKISGLKLQAAQTDATAGIAQKMGLLNSTNDPDGMQALAMIQATPWNQKISIGPYMIQMIGQKTLADHYAQQKASTSAGKTAPVDLY